jgi:hypothetical protein
MARARRRRGLVEGDPQAVAESGSAVMGICHTASLPLWPRRPAQSLGCWSSSKRKRRVRYSRADRLSAFLSAGALPDRLSPASPAARDRGRCATRSPTRRPPKRPRKRRALRVVVFPSPPPRRGRANQSSPGRFHRCRSRSRPRTAAAGYSRLRRSPRRTKFARF